MTTHDGGVRIFDRRPATRWLVPVLVAVLMLAGGSVASALTTAVRDPLPERSAAEILVDVQEATLDGFSGTVEHSADLGLPALPGAGGRGGADFSALLAGSHTLRVWYADPAHVRVALLGDESESALVRNGADLWTWSSRDRTATLRTLPGTATSGQVPENLAALTGLDPRQVADLLLSTLAPSTSVTTDGTAVVAGRSAYELVLEPKDDRSLVAGVRIAVDGETSIPTRVQVLARDRQDPAFEVGFTSFDPGTPDDAVFDFEPPPGTEVTEVPGKDEAGPRTKGFEGMPFGDMRFGGTPFGDAAGATVVGSGWTSVLVTEVPALAEGSQGSDLAGRFLEALPRVSGDWGSGHVVRGTLFTALLTDDGRLAAGAVPPELLYRALDAP